MSTKVSLKVDKFFLLFAVVMLLMAGIVVFCFQTIFSSVRDSYEVVTQVSDSELKIDKDKLTKAKDAFDTRKIVPLEIR